MRVSAFLRSKTAKNNITEKATVFFRVRDDKNHIDIKAASELRINPNHWSNERQGYKPRITQVDTEVRLQFDKAIMEITALISKGFHIGADSKWLQKVIFAYHHPNAYCYQDGQLVETGLAVWGEKFIEARKRDVHQASNYRGVVEKIRRFETYIQTIKRQKNYVFSLGCITHHDLESFRNYVEQEPELVEKYPSLIIGLDKRQLRSCKLVRGGNTVNNIMAMVRTIVNYAIANGAVGVNPFDRYEMPTTLYGTPFYITIEERDKILNLDISDDPILAEYRDMFVFQCLVGCRHGDLVRFKPSNIINDVLEYIPTKTINKVGVTLRVPLGPKAKSILERHPTENDECIFKMRFNFKYNDAIRDIMTRAEITRPVTVIDTRTRREVKRPINEIASSHMARRTFIGNLYKKVQDPNIIGSMSGHTAGSRAFTRYRAIDDDMKKNLIDLLDIDTDEDGDISPDKPSKPK